MKEIKISFTPSEQNVYEIRDWVNYPESSMGTIYDCYKKCALVVATFNEKAIAYYALRLKDVTVSIELAEVHDEFRNSGIGKMILNEIEEKMQNTQYKAFSLYCSPKESQFYWKRVGFDYYPENQRENRNDKINMFKIFAPVSKNIENDLIDANDNCEYLEVWNDKSMSIKNTPASWVWKLEFIEKDSSVLRLPFLFFGDRNWKIRWLKGSKIIKECDYKDFDRKNEIYECMYITQMPSI